MDKQIAQAFVKAQKAFGPALKGSTNPHFRSKYADLAACIEAVIDALHNNGIALIQHQHECSDGVLVETVFVHESGEEYSTGKLHVPADKATAQGYGSALTYARRYGLMAACGIAPEDDDGNSARAPQRQQRAPQKQGVQKVNAKKQLSPELAKAKSDFALWLDELRDGMYDTPTPEFMTKLWKNQYGTEAYTDPFQLENLKVRINSGQINLENGETLEGK